MKKMTKSPICLPPSYLIYEARRFLHMQERGRWRSMARVIQQVVRVEWLSVREVWQIGRKRIGLI